MRVRALRLPLAVALTGLIVPAAAAGDAGSRLTIAYTAEVRANLLPCTCPVEPLGGLARRVGWVDSLRQAVEGPLLLLDAGDLLPARDSFRALPETQWRALRDLHAEACREMGYDFLVRDPGQTPDAATRELPWIAPGEARVIRRGGLRIAIVAVDERRDPWPARGALAQAGRADLVILLCAGDLHFARRVAPDLGASVCVVARGAAFSAPRVEDGILYLGAGREGKHIGLAELDVTDPRRVRPLRVRLHRMGASVPSPEAWRDRVEKLVLAIEKTSPGALAAGE